MLPDYSGGSLVNLMATLAQACGASARHAPLEGLAVEEFATARNIVLLIVDGLGEHYLRRRGAGGELERRRRRAITSVFPSTTATAITTTYTGCAPLEHGLTGWFSYFGEAACVGAPLPFMSRGDGLSLSRRGVAPAALYAGEPFFAQIARRSLVVTYRDIVDSTYNRHYCRGAERIAYETADALPAAIERAAKSGPDAKFIYAYWPDYDRVSHRYGSESGEALAELEKIDAAFGSVLAALSGTDSVVVATADHGFVDVPPECALELPAALAAQLRYPLSGERRVAYCHVTDKERFERDAQDWLGERADVFESGWLADQGWFGGGARHPRFAERIGDVTLVMRERYTIKDWLAGESRHQHIGNHGGTSEEEMRIPLIVERA